jgi:hypothetical protein
MIPTFIRFLAEAVAVSLFIAAVAVWAGPGAKLLLH